MPSLLWHTLLIAASLPCLAPGPHNPADLELGAKPSWIAGEVAAEREDGK